MTTRGDEVPPRVGDRTGRPARVGDTTVFVSVGGKMSNGADFTVD
jgi:hypothetical protein